MTVEDFTNKLAFDHPARLRAAPLILSGIVVGIASLAIRGISHRDLKPDNVMLPMKKKGKSGSSDAPRPEDVEVGEPILVDYGESGTAEAGSGKLKTVAGTPAFRGPEVVHQEEYDGLANDIHGAGATIMLLLDTTDDFEKALEELWGQPEELVAAIFESVKGKHDLAENDPAIDLLRRMTDKDPARRPSLHEIFEHPFLSSTRPYEGIESFLFERKYAEMVFKNKQLTRQLEEAAAQSRRLSPIPEDGAEDEREITATVTQDSGEAQDESARTILEEYSNSSLGDLDFAEMDWTGPEHSIVFSKNVKISPPSKENALWSEPTKSIPVFLFFLFLKAHYNNGSGKRIATEKVGSERLRLSVAKAASAAKEDNKNRQSKLYKYFKDTFKQKNFKPVHLTKLQELDTLADKDKLWGEFAERVVVASLETLYHKLKDEDLTEFTCFEQLEQLVCNTFQNTFFDCGAYYWAGAATSFSQVLWETHQNRTS